MNTRNTPETERLYNFKKQNIKLIILFTVSNLLVFAVVFGLMPLSYYIFVPDEPVKWNILLKIPGLTDFIWIGLFGGIAFSVFGLLRFTMTTIVSLIRLFIIIFIVLFVVIYIFLKAI